MQQAITFTPEQLVEVILAVCKGLTCIAGGVGVILLIYKWVRGPERKIHDRMSALEYKVSELETKVSQDAERLKILEKGNRITQRAMLALLKHAIDGNDIDSLKKVEIELENFLIEG